MLAAHQDQARCRILRVGYEQVAHPGEPGPRLAQWRNCRCGQLQDRRIFTSLAAVKDQVFIAGLEIGAAQLPAQAIENDPSPVIFGAVSIEASPGHTDRSEDAVNGGQKNGQYADRNQHLDQREAARRTCTLAGSRTALAARRDPRRRKR